MIESFNDKVLQEDLEIIAKEELPFRKFRNSTVFITGVTGLVGLQLFKALGEVHILDDEAAARAYIEQMWAEAMTVYRLSLIHI